MAAPGARPGDPWAPPCGRKVHTHDVRALIRHDARRNDSHSGMVRAQRFVAGSLDATISEFGLGALLKDSRIKRLRPFSGPDVQPKVHLMGGRVVSWHGIKIASTCGLFRRASASFNSKTWAA
jgi:hypothetical protein